MQDNEFQCEACKGVFIKGWTDEECQAEGDAAFGDYLGSNPAVVCDDCYQKMMSDYPPADFIRDMQEV